MEISKKKKVPHYMAKLETLKLYGIRTIDAFRIFSAHIISHHCVLFNFCKFKCSSLISLEEKRACLGEVLFKEMG